MKQKVRITNFTKSIMMSTLADICVSVLNRFPLPAGKQRADGERANPFTVHPPFEAPR